MAYSVVPGQGHIGPMEIWAKDFATHGGDPDFNSVSGFSEILELDPGSPGNINFNEEFMAQRAASRLAAHREDLIAQELNVDGVANMANLYSLAYAMGKIDSLIEDKTGDTPTRLQLPIGGYRTINYQSIILRQKHPDIAAKYIGIYLLKTHIKLNGALNLQVDDHSKIPFEIRAVTPASGTYEGVLAYPYEEYGPAVPNIATILPASQSIGNTVVIAGSGFGATIGDSVVTFNSGKVAITYLSWTDNFISVVIPAAATTGNVKVTVGGVDSNDVSYTIT